MEFYLSIDGEKHGPVPMLKVGDLLRDGKVTPETLGWHRDLESWKPLSEIPALETIIEREVPFETGPPIATSPSSPEEEGEEGEETFEPITRRESAGPDAVQERKSVVSPLPGEAPGAGAELEVEVPPEARPLVRFWARMFDYTLVSVVVFLFSGYALPEANPGESFSDLLSRYLEEMQRSEAAVLARTQFFALVGWHLVEGVLIHLVGTTPGKALFRIQVVTSERRRIPLKRSIGRSYYVYLLGVGLYQFPFILIGMTFSFFRIMAAGKSLWDQHLDLRVEGRPLGVGRIMLAIFAFLALMMLQSLKIS